MGGWRFPSFSICHQAKSERKFKEVNFLNKTIKLFKGKMEPVRTWSAAKPDQLIKFHRSLWVLTWPTLACERKMNLLQFEVNSSLFYRDLPRGKLMIPPLKLLLSLVTINQISRSFPTWCWQPASVQGEAGHTSLHGKVRTVLIKCEKFVKIDEVLVHL